MSENKELSLDGYLLEKDRIEIAITKAVALLVDHFQYRTGVDVRSVDIQFHEITRVGDIKRSFLIGKTVITTVLDGEK